MAAAGGAGWVPPVKKVSPKHISEKYLAERPLGSHKRQLGATGGNSNSEEGPIAKINIEGIQNTTSFYDEFISLLNKIWARRADSVDPEELLQMVRSFKHYYTKLDNLIEIPQSKKDVYQQYILTKPDEAVPFDVLRQVGTFDLAQLIERAKQSGANELASMGPPHRGGARKRRHRATKKLRGRRPKATRRR
jgi:hypothetical protein